MAGDSLKISTDQVRQIATNIENANTRLAEELQKSRNTLNGLANIWQGEAATATQDSFESFANQYFKTYDDTIQSYVKFLRDTAEAYDVVETQNVSLADAFK